MKTKVSQAEQLMVPFLLAGGDPNWVPRTPIMGLKRFEPKTDAQQAPRSRRGRRGRPTDPPLSGQVSEVNDNDFE